MEISRSHQKHYAKMKVQELESWEWFKTSKYGVVLVFVKKKSKNNIKFPRLQ